MVILIDAYNLLKKLHGVVVTETERRAFVNLLGAYLKRRNHKVIVVFDAGPSPLPETEKQKGVTIWYSGAYQSADDLIVAYAKENRNKDLVVVTLDREIRTKVGECRVETLDPMEFYEKIKSICYPQQSSTSFFTEQLCKLSEEENPELDALMNEAAKMRMPYKDEVGGTARKASPSQRISKKDKVRQKVLDKL